MLGELDLLDEFNKPFHGESRLGQLDVPQFLALLLDWQLTGNFKVIDKVQSDVDRLDEDLLEHSPTRTSCYAVFSGCGGRFVSGGTRSAPIAGCWAC
ncbi:MAG TPA: hypothetical protein VHL52_00750 [Acidimicrobiia bacterium]|nr:hypothetical protein [Acidimicrobiia bacterium]